MESLQCPGEPYTLTRHLCRGRQAKGYAKCPSCVHREAVLPAPAVPVPALELEPETCVPAASGLMERVRALHRVSVPAPALAVAGGGSAGGDLRSLMRRLYDYF